MTKQEFLAEMSEELDRGMCPVAEHYCCFADTGLLCSQYQNRHWCKEFNVNCAKLQDEAKFGVDANDDECEYYTM